MPVILLDWFFRQQLKPSIVYTANDSPDVHNSKRQTLRMRARVNLAVAHILHTPNTRSLDINPVIACSKSWHYFYSLKLFFSKYWLRTRFRCHHGVWPKSAYHTRYKYKQNSHSQNLKIICTTIFDKPYLIRFKIDYHIVTKYRLLVTSMTVYKSHNFYNIKIVSVN